MALILCIETATPVCSVCLIENSTLLSERLNILGNQHAAILTTMIQEVFDESNLGIKELKAVAVSKGPGSYTGLRVGVSTAKGLCYALGIPLIAINTLASLAFGYINHVTEGELIIPLLDARRMEVYCGVYSSKGTAIGNTEAKIIDENAFKNLLDQSVCHLIGSGATKCKPVIQHVNARFNDELLCKATTMIEQAIRAFNNQEFENTAYFEPYYLKDFYSPALLNK